MTLDPLVGQQLANFRIERVIGRGGMGQIYAGLDVKLERPVAIKVIDTRHRGDPGYAERFIREARAIAAWRHENIIQIFYADDQDGLYFFAMELIDGEDLGQLIARHAREGRLIEQREVVRLGRAIAGALDYAHGKGVIHRDVKPSNVMVAGDGRVVLMDFGLALDAQQGSVGEVFGSSRYIAPEQARRSSDAVPQSDLYALGVVLYEMLTGAVPFDDPSPTSVALQHLTLPPPAPRQVNPALSVAIEEVLLKALAKAPGERYASGAELIDALERAVLIGQSQPLVSSDNLIGQQLGDYQLEGLLGRGGMAHIYRGRDSSLKRQVAIKVIDTPFRQDAEYVGRFQREAQAIASLEHPNIVRLYQYGEAQGVLYIAMEFVDGTNLEELLRRHRLGEQRLGNSAILRLLREICSALDYAHGKGVIHRDVKPSNVMVAGDGRAVLTDFGLALIASEGTRGEIFGSPHYVAPEQAISSASAVGQSDLYSVGVILYELFAGRVPFDGADAMAIAMHHMTDPPPPPRELEPSISLELEHALLKMLAKDPAERYPTGAALADAVEHALHEAPTGGYARPGALGALPPPPVVARQTTPPPAGAQPSFTPPVSAEAPSFLRDGTPAADQGSGIRGQGADETVAPPAAARPPLPPPPVVARQTPPPPASGPPAAQPGFTPPMSAEAPGFLRDGTPAHVAPGPALKDALSPVSRGVVPPALTGRETPAPAVDAGRGAGAGAPWTPPPPPVVGRSAPAGQSIHEQPTAALPTAPVSASRPGGSIHEQPTTVMPTVPPAGSPAAARPLPALPPGVRPPDARRAGAAGPLAGAPPWLRDRRVLAGLIAAPLLALALFLATRGDGEQDAATGATTTPSATVTAGDGKATATAPATAPAGEVSAVTEEPAATQPAGSPAELTGEVAVENAFDKTSSWQDGSSAFFQDGRYRLASGLTYYRQASGNLPNGDVAIAVNVEPLQGQAGIAFGLNGVNDHYRLLSAPDGSWSLERRFGSRTPTPIASGTGAGKGRLALVLRGARAKVYFNDAPLAEADLPGEPSRKYGVILVPGAGGEALFDTLTVRAAP